jgi:hypothetical protein
VADTEAAVARRGDEATLVVDHRPCADAHDAPDTPRPGEAGDVGTAAPRTIVRAEQVESLHAVGCVAERGEAAA